MSFEIFLDKRLACIECNSPEAVYWHRNEAGDTVCDVCYKPNTEVPNSQKNRNSRSQGLLSPAAALTKKETDEASKLAETPAAGASTAKTTTTRKSSRLKPSKTRHGQNTMKPSATKGRSRRLIFKKNVTKAPTSVSTIVSRDYIFYEGSYWQIGDVVSVIDVDDGLRYYAQLRGFLEDEYCCKSAVITWLIPKPGCSVDVQKRKTAFDLSSFTVGPEEDLPRDMSHFEFVCHAPSDYFIHGSNRRSYSGLNPPIGCIWTSLGPEIQPMEMDTDDDDLTDSLPSTKTDKTKKTGKNGPLKKVETNDSVKKVASNSNEKTRPRKTCTSRFKDKK